MPKAFLYLLLALPLILSGCFSNKKASRFDASVLQPATAEMVNLLDEDDFVGTERVAREPTVSGAYVNRMALMENASEAELLALMNHPEGEVVATAFEGLAMQQYNELKQVLLDLSEREIRVSYLAGDVLRTLPVLEYAYVYVLKYDFENPSPSTVPIDIGLSAEEKAFIENRILAIRQLI